MILLLIKNFEFRLRFMMINDRFTAYKIAAGLPLESCFGPEKILITGFDISDLAEVSNSLLNEKFNIFEEIESSRGLFRRSVNYPVNNSPVANRVINQSKTTGGAGPLILNREL